MLLLPRTQVNIQGNDLNMVTFNEYSDLDWTQPVLYVIAWRQLIGGGLTNWSASPALSRDALWSLRGRRKRGWGMMKLSHVLQHTLALLLSSVCNRMLHPKCSKEKCGSVAFLPAVVWFHVRRLSQRAAASTGFNPDRMQSQICTYVHCLYSLLHLNVFFFLSYFGIISANAVNDYI